MPASAPLPTRGNIRMHTGRFPSQDRIGIMRPRPTLRRLRLDHLLSLAPGNGAQKNNRQSDVVKITNALLCLPMRLLQPSPQRESPHRRIMPLHGMSEIDRMRRSRWNHPTDSHQRRGSTKSVAPLRWAVKCSRSYSRTFSKSNVHNLVHVTPAGTGIGSLLKVAFRVAKGAASHRQVELPSPRPGSKGVWEMRAVFRRRNNI